MRPEVVSFSSVPNRYQIHSYQCDHVDCTCTEVTFALKEITSKHVAKRRSGKVVIRVDVPTWQENKPPERTPEDVALVAEFLRDYPESERDELMDWYRERTRILQRLDTYRMDPADVQNGRLFSFRDILAPPDDLYWDCPLGEHSFDDEDMPYVVTERFCVNPNCDCREAYLSFLLIRPHPDSPDTNVAEEQFLGRISMEGKVRLESLHGTDAATANRLLAAWEEGVSADDLDRLKWRYDKIREIGRRSVPIRSTKRPPERQRIPAFLEEPERTSKRVGRNDPCPCGSGRKYKKCCARNDDILSY